jgi:5-methyltetrahydrofolate--homocysteine methyltransferase
MDAANELKAMADLLQQGNTSAVKSLLQKLLDNGVTPQVILNDGLIAGMSAVGEKMGCGEMYLPEVLQCASVMKAAMELLQPHLLKTGVEPRGRVVLGTVKGDMHDIGKNLVGIMLRGAGYEVIDLGINAPAEKFVEAIERNRPQVLGMSALLTTTMQQMKNTITAIVAAHWREHVKIIIGGAPVSQRFAEEIGADGYAKDAVAAVAEVRALLTRTT